MKMQTASSASNDRSEYYFKSLVSVLEPDLGRQMAKTTLRQYCRELGIKDTKIAEEHIDPIALRLRSGLSSFVGQGRLDSLIHQIQKIKEYDDWGIL